MLLILAAAQLISTFTLMSCFSEQGSKESKAAAKHSAEGTDIGFNKTPGVAEDAGSSFPTASPTCLTGKEKMGDWRQEKARADGKESRRSITQRTGTSFQDAKSNHSSS